MQYPPSDELTCDVLFAYIDQIPPTMRRCSRIATSKPSSVSRLAAMRPRIPAPTTTTSSLLFWGGNTEAVFVIISFFGASTSCRLSKPRFLAISCATRVAMAAGSSFWFTQVRSTARECAPANAANALLLLPLLPVNGSAVRKTQLGRRDTLLSASRRPRTVMAAWWPLSPTPTTARGESTAHRSAANAVWQAPVVASLSSKKSVNAARPPSF
mmetsp:Transcript_52879/g.72171  ORF Transcript_52879/g.72171 Transcript_52879/m.72171 type:complete len:213 (+) Transcript_52879:965-1603(+)